MITIKLNEEIKSEIKKSIIDFNVLISREMSISEDLRKKDKVLLWENKVSELKQALTNGYI